MVKINKPKIRYVEDEIFDNALINNDFYQKSFSNSPNKEIYLEDIKIEECTFNKIDFSLIHLKNVEFVDCVFSSCNLNMLDFSKTSIYRTSFVDSKINGLKICTKCKDISFINCNCNYFNLSDAIIESLEIKDSSFTNSYFSNAQLFNVTFKNVDLSKSEFFKTSLSSIDISSCNVDGISIDLNSLKGCIVSKDQALAFSKLLGINIK